MQHGSSSRSTSTRTKVELSAPHGSTKDLRTTDDIWFVEQTQISGEKNLDQIPRTPVNSHAYLTFSTSAGPRGTPGSAAPNFLLLTLVDPLKTLYLPIQSAPCTETSARDLLFRGSTPTTERAQTIRNSGDPGQGPVIHSCDLLPLRVWRGCVVALCRGMRSLEGVVSCVHVVCSSNDITSHSLRFLTLVHSCHRTSTSLIESRHHRLSHLTCSCFLSCHGSGAQHTVPVIQ